MRVVTTETTRNGKAQMTRVRRYAETPVGVGEAVPIRTPFLRTPPVTTIY